MSNDNEDIDFMDVLRNRVEQGEPLIVLGSPTPETEQLIETATSQLSKETDKPVKVLHVVNLDAIEKK